MLAAKYSLIIAIVLILVAVAVFIIFKPDVKPEIVKIYKAVEPADKSTTPLAESETPEITPTTQETSVDMVETPITQEEDGNFNNESVDFIEPLDLFDDLLEEEISQTDVVDVPISPFGFGEYPEVPPDFPLSVVWEAPEEHQAQMPSDLLEELELLGFVMIKKWNEGDHDFVGAFMANGKVYPTYPDVAYVKWDKTQESGEWRISEISTVDSAISEQLLNGVFPPGIEIVNQDSSGIDPHKFLSQ